MIRKNQKNNTIISTKVLSGKQIEKSRSQKSYTAAFNLARLALPNFSLA